jgi:flagellar biosynthesis protein FlhG
MEDFMPEDVAVVGPQGIQVISGGSGLRELANASTADRRALLDKLAGYYRTFDRVVIDTSPGIGADVTDFLSGADEILLVTTPEPTSLRDTYAALKNMTPLCHNDNSIRLVVNMVTSEAQAAQAVTVLNEVTGRFIDRRFGDWHFVTSDALVGRSIRARKPLVCEYRRSAAALCLRQLAGSLQLRAMPGLPECSSVGGL